MDDFTLFYAWQSDVDAKLNRYLIRDAAKDALKELAKDAILDEAPRLDSDTQNAAGAPEVAATIFSKIDKAGLFLADLTFIGTSIHDDQLPNSNVLLELGYAAARIGWSRTILVMNTAFGPPDNLIFDLRHRRWPITYHLDSQDKTAVKDEQLRLAARIKDAILVAAQEQHTAVINAVDKLDFHCLRWMSDLGNRDWFQQPPRSSMGEILGNQAIDSALIRLLEIGVLRCDVNPAAGLYAYHWTHFGKLVLKHLGMRTESKPT